MGRLSNRIKEELDSGDDLSDDTIFPGNRRKTHTAKTAPPRLRVRRHKDEDDDDDDDDDDNDDDNNVDRTALRQVKTSVPTRRELLSQRRQEDRRARESDYEKAEVFLRKLRQDVAKEHLDDFPHLLTRREFTAYLLNKVRAGPPNGAFWGEEGDGGGEGNEWQAEETSEKGAETWAQARMDMVYPIKRLGNIASVFPKNSLSKDSPADAGSKGRTSSAHKRQLLNGGGAGGAGVGGFPGIGGDGGGALGGALGRADRGETSGERSRPSSVQRAQRHRSVFEITENDPPADALPRHACMPDLNRVRRDTLVDTARAFGFGEAAVVVSGKAGRNSPPPRECSPVGPSAPQGQALFTRAGLAERRRAERRAKAKPLMHTSGTGGSRLALGRKDETHGPDVLRTLLQMKSRFRAKPLDDRVKDFMRDLDDLEQGRRGAYRLESLH